MDEVPYIHPLLRPDPPQRVEPRQVKVNKALVIAQAVMPHLKQFGRGLGRMLLIASILAIPISLAIGAVYCVDHHVVWPVWALLGFLLLMLTYTAGA